MLTAGVILSERVTVGSDCWLMANSTVRDKVTVGHGVTVGMGSVVVRDLQSGNTYVGNPARLLDKSGNGPG